MGFEGPYSLPTVLLPDRYHPQEVRYEVTLAIPNASSLPEAEVTVQVGGHVL